MPKTREWLKATQGVWITSDGKFTINEFADGTVVRREARVASSNPADPYVPITGWYNPTEFPSVELAMVSVGPQEDE
jgi:hypothetical protein